MRRRRKSGNAVIEVALVAPWIFFLFAALLDFGFYAYALVSVENAVRAAAIQNSGSTAAAADAEGACGAVLGELRRLPNIGNSVTGCNALPLRVTAAQVTGPDGAPAARVSVTYQSMRMIPIPWLGGQMTVTRFAEMRVVPD